MARYRMEDGTVVDTQNANHTWEAVSEFDGHNSVDIHTGSQWVDQLLHRSRRGRYYTETKSRMQGSTDRAEWVSLEEAARWLLLAEAEIPGDLAEAAETVSE